MNTKYIKELLNKYFAAETSPEEERELRAYFKQNIIDDELLAYTPLFRQFNDEKQISAPSSAMNKLKVVQKYAAENKRKRIQYIGLISIAASLFIVLTVGIFSHQHKTTNNDAVFVMYSNGQRIDDPIAALDFTRQELEKISKTFNKANDLIAKPINTIEESLAPLKKTNRQINKAEELFNFKK